MEDQQLLEEAWRAGGIDSVNAAMAKLKGEALPTQESFGVDAPPEEEAPAEEVPAGEGWEWALDAYPEPLADGQQYEFRNEYVEADEAMEMLRAD